MRLLLVELSRFRSRRAIALMLLMAALLTAVLVTITVWDTRPISAKDQASAQAQADAEKQRPGFQRQLDRCHKHPQRYMGENDPTLCDQNMTPQPEWFLNRQSLSLDQEQGDTGMAVLILVAAVSMIAGTTFAGADWASGSISNQMIFEPRRLKVWLAKAGAVMIGALVASAVIVAAFWLMLYVVAESRGIHTGSTVQEHIRWFGGRGVLLATFGALGGYALTMLLRHTVGTLALLFGYVVVGETLVAALPIEHAGRWSPSNNMLAWLDNGTEVYDPRMPCLEDMCNQVFTVTLNQGVTYLVVLLLVVLIPSILLFLRRDIP